MNEAIANSQLDRPKSKDALEDHYEASSEAKLARKKMADLEVEVCILSKIFERISAEMLEMREKANGPKESSEAGEIPTTQIPLGAEVNRIADDASVEVENNASHANKTAPGGRILKFLQPEPDNALAIPTLASRDADILAKTYEHRLREQIREVTAERIKAVEERKCYV
ncbi:hypothetical protein B9Z19DRAFT_1069295 [Tuber borchii]|uniref:Uncharacterized protein n=1 Tax=Tuber borchii TaxID=42251 RepID=A0A2T6ZCA3_TUBBO|nr:hypothetical protein B9Z19DRAFT_1069295 [Tuber borchii]